MLTVFVREETRLGEEEEPLSHAKPFFQNKEREHEMARDSGKERESRTPLRRGLSGPSLLLGRGRGWPGTHRGQGEVCGPEQQASLTLTRPELEITAGGRSKSTSPRWVHFE